MASERGLVQVAGVGPQLYIHGREKLHVDLLKCFRGRAIKLRGGVSAAVAVLLLLAACRPGADLPPLPPPDNVVYTLAAGDQVRVITFGEPTLTGQFSVEDSGDIAIPLLGSLHVVGLTTSQLAHTIETQLREKNLIRSPSVSTEIVSYRPIYVLGEVSKPGEYPFRPGMTVLAAVALAGGFTYRAVEDSASVVRTLHGKSIEGLVNRNTLLEPGDVVTVFERNF